MGETRKCAQCGARPTDIKAVYCQFCGTELPQREVVPVQVIGPHGDLDARFAALEEHRDLPRLFEHSPSPTRAGLGMVGIIIFGGIFTAVSLVVTAGFGVAGGPAALFPLIFVAAGFFMIAKGVINAAKFTNAPLVRTLAVVIDERTSVSGGGNNSSASTTYFATLQNKAGERGEYRVHDRVAGKIAPGDMGVAYIKSGYMLDFERVKV